MKSHRRLISLTLATALSFGISAHAWAESVTGAWTHAFTMGEEAKYPADFAHFDYVNPEAPKAGTLRLGTRGGFDTFNPILPKGDTAAGLGLTYDTLLVPSLDENNTYYGHLAHELLIEPDYSAVTFRLDPDARWHDGESITATDVVWTFEKMIELSPNQAQYYASVSKAEALSDGEVKFSFSEKNNRELPLILGQLLVLPQHWWEGTDAKGNPRDIGASTQEPPLGSGSYKLATFDAGKTITYERVPDYWATEKPTEVGQNNFDTLKYEYFLDESVWFEGFKGDQFDFWSEYSARRWATGFDFPAVTDGRVVREEFPQDYASSGLMTGFIPNLRREKFQNEKLREAINYTFDFEELNRTVFFEQYERIDSFFYGLPFAAKDLPQGEELEILESVRELIPESVFTEPYANPVAGDSTKLRANLRSAIALFNEAGYTLTGNQMVDVSGQPLEIELLSHQSSLEPVFQNLATNLKQIGVTLNLRFVDTPQYINRLRSFDYDMVYTQWAQSFSPGNEQRFFFGSGSATAEGSQNYAGIADNGIDVLIEKLIAADDRATQEAASAALDRALLHHHYVIPGYTLRHSRTARWDRFSHPEALPAFSSGFPTIWWWDETKAANTK
jgi:microcin C transport system substrate-binding protein